MARNVRLLIVTTARIDRDGSHCAEDCPNINDNWCERFGPLSHAEDGSDRRERRQDCFDAEDAAATKKPRRKGKR